MARTELFIPQPDNKEPFPSNGDIFVPSHETDSLRKRRHRVTKILTNKHLLPQEVEANSDDIEKARELRRKGYGLILPYTHPDMRSPVDTMVAMINLGDGFDDAVYVGPLAWHQQHHPHLKILSWASDVDLKLIVTRNTIERGKDRELYTPRQKVKRAALTIFGKDLQEPKKLSPRHGLAEYLDAGAEALIQGGNVFVAPQGGRRDYLGSPAGPAVEMLINTAQRKQNKLNPGEPLKIAIWPIGVVPKGVDKFDKSTSGLNLGKVAHIQFGTPLTLEEFYYEAEHRESLANSKLKIDNLVFEEFTHLVPESYLQAA